MIRRLAAGHPVANLILECNILNLFSNFKWVRNSGLVIVTWIGKKMKVFKWAKLGKQGWRFGMNQKSSKSDQL